MQAWIAQADDIMRSAGCRVARKPHKPNDKMDTDATFTYTSKHTKKTVCYLHIKKSGCWISLRGHHFLQPSNDLTILDEYPAILPRVKRVCGCRRADNTIDPANACVHGVNALYAHNGETYQYCLFHGFDFAVNEESDFALLTRWVELEAQFAGKIINMNLPFAKIPDIQFDEIDIDDKYLHGRDKNRCINALWSIYNVIKKMSVNKSFRYASMFLYEFGKNGVFTDDEMNALRWSKGFDSNKSWVPGPKYQYLPTDFGFVYSNMVYKDGVQPKKKEDMQNICALSVSYDGDDFTDVMYGLQLFVEICDQQPWPYFFEADVRVAI